MAILDPATCRTDQNSLAGSAIGAPRARRKSTTRCDDDVRQVRLLAENASASDLEAEGVEATLCAGCANNYEHRVSNCGCSACGLRLAAGVVRVPGVAMMCTTCVVMHVSLAASDACDATVKRGGAAPLRARVAELEAATPHSPPARLAPPSRFDGWMPATDPNGHDLGEGARGYCLPGMGCEKGTWVPLNPQLAEVVASGLTVVVLVRKPDDAPLSVADYFYFKAQVRGMALEESPGSPALELYVEGTGRSCSRRQLWTGAMTEPSSPPTHFVSVVPPPCQPLVSTQTTKSAGLAGGRVIAGICTSTPRGRRSRTSQLRCLVFM